MGSQKDVSQRIRFLITLKGTIIQQFADSLEFPKGTLEKYINSRRLPNAEFLSALLSRMRVSAHWLLDGEDPTYLADREEFERYGIPLEDGPHLGPPYFTGRNITGGDPDFVPIEASAGPGALVDEETQTGFYACNRRWLDRRQLDPGSLAEIAMRGDSMEPKLSDGDLILVDRAQRQIADGIAYVLRIDTDLLVKNVPRVRPGVIALLSANALYPPREIDADGLDGQVKIIGRIVASMHEW